MSGRLCSTGSTKEVPKFTWRRTRTRCTFTIFRPPALDGYQDKAVTVRSPDAGALIEAFSAVPQEKLLFLQVLSMDCDADALLHLGGARCRSTWSWSTRPRSSRLHPLRRAAGTHPVRVTVRAAAGMTKAVKVAEALNFSVKLDVGQPDAAVGEELLALAEYYLRGANVTRPVEPLHALFLSFFSGNATNLWQLQEEDPATDRYVGDDGRRSLLERLAASGIPRIS